VHPARGTLSTVTIPEILRLILGGILCDLLYALLFANSAPLCPGKNLGSKLMPASGSTIISSAEGVFLSMAFGLAFLRAFWIVLMIIASVVVFPAVVLLAWKLRDVRGVYLATTIGVLAVLGCTFLSAAVTFHQAIGHHTYLHQACALLCLFLPPFASPMLVAAALTPSLRRRIRSYVTTYVVLAAASIVAEIVGIVVADIIGWNWFST
jgi:hypothetical protein